MLTEKKKRDGASFSLHDKRELERLVRMRTSRTYRQREKQQKERLAEQRGREGDRESKLAELLDTIQHLERSVAEATRREKEYQARE